VVMRRSSQGQDVTQTRVEESFDDCKPTKFARVVCLVLYASMSFYKINTIG